MKKRIKKKRWKEETTQQQADLMERVAALEELSLRQAQAQGTLLKWVDSVEMELNRYLTAQNRRNAIEDERRRRQARIRMEREQERRRRRKDWAKLLALAAFAVAFMCFAVTFPAPEMIEPEEPIQSAVVTVCPAQGVAEAVALSLGHR